MTKNTQMTNSATGPMLSVALANVAPSASNPRMTLDKDAFKELKKSILENGLLQPIAVRVVGDNYEIVGGHRRYHAIRELAHEHPNDPRFATIAALVVDLADKRVAAARLAENINRAELNPREVAEGVAEAINSGMTEEELAASLGWKPRNVYRYRQLHSAPGWLKSFATEVPVASKKVDEHGAPVLDGVTDAPVHDIEKLPGLGVTHLFELITFYNLLREADELELHEKGGEHFRPQAERIVKKLARGAAKEQWSIAKLRAEIKRLRDPAPRTPVSNDAKAAFVITAESATIHLTRPLSRQEREELAAKLAPALKALGFKHVVLGDVVAQ